MKFREFPNPESADYDILPLNPEDADYDIRMSYPETYDDEVKPKEKRDKVKEAFTQLWFDLGLPELYELEPYGITEAEFYKPSMDTLNKLKRYQMDMEKEYKKTR